MTVAITTDTSCKVCGQSLTLEEMHYYERPDGSATCNDCERKWSDEMDEWRRGERIIPPVAGDY